MSGDAFELTTNR